jgi:type IV fimbrial biogenesis protein FimT
MSPRRFRPRAIAAQRGFTLVELLVAGCIAVLLMLPSVHMAQEAFNSIRLSALANSFHAQLYLARSEAIKRNGSVAVCKSRDGVFCVTDGGWEQGSIVFHDLDNNAERGPEEPIVYRLQALPAGFRLQGNASMARYVSFAPNGGTRTAAGAFQAGTLTVCRSSDGPTEARQVVINAIGRPRIQKVTVASCD